jgi:hypothetical protein
VRRVLPVALDERLDAVVRRDDELRPDVVLRAAAAVLRPDLRVAEPVLRLAVPVRGVPLRPVVRRRLEDPERADVRLVRRVAAPRLALVLRRRRVPPLRSAAGISA